LRPYIAQWYQCFNSLFRAVFLSALTGNRGYSADLYVSERKSLGLFERELDRNFWVRITPALAMFLITVASVLFGMLLMRWGMLV
jgi:hypothetical protein